MQEGYIYINFGKSVMYFDEHVSEGPKARSCLYATFVCGCYPFQLSCLNFLWSSILISVQSCYLDSASWDSTAGPRSESKDTTFHFIGIFSSTYCSHLLHG